jgi:hypothetical protein
VRTVVGGVDSDLRQRLYNRRLGCLAMRIRPGRTSLVTAGGGSSKEPLRHHAPPAVPDADKKNVHANTSRSAASGSGTTR